MPSAEAYGVVKLKAILFGDDNFGTVLDEEAPYKNNKGIMMKRYLVIPGEHLMKQYPELRKPGALPVEGRALWVEYPAYWVSDTNPSRTNAIARIDCGFDGRATALTRRHKVKDEEIKQLREELENASISNMHLEEENKVLLSQKMEFVKNVAEINSMIRGDRGGAHEEYRRED